MTGAEDGARTAHNAEIHHIRENRRSLSVEDLDDVEEIGESIADSVTMLLHQYVLDVGVKRVYICGSFARGEATAVLSDLDVRAVLDEAVEPFTAESIEGELKNEAGFDIIPDDCGFLDPRLTTKDPAEDTASVLVWESDMK